MNKNWKIIREILGLRGLSTIGLTNVVTSAITGIFWIYIAGLVGTSEYGKLSYLIAIATVSSSLSSLGASTTLMVYTAKEVKLESTLYLIGSISGIVGSVILFFIFQSVAASVYSIGIIISYFGINELLGKKFYRQFAKYSITQKIIQVCLSLVLFYFLGPQGIILGFGLSFIPYLIRIYNGFREIPLNFSLLRSRLGFMMNNYVLELSRTSASYLDRIIIFPMFGFVLLGNYQLGTQILMLLSLLPNAVFQYVLSHDASGNPNKNLKIVTIIASVILASVTILLAPIVLPIVLPEYRQSISIVQITSIAIFPMTVNTMFFSKFLGNERGKIVLLGSGIYIISQISSIIVLGNLYSANGVAASLVIANSVECVYLLCMNNRIRKDLPVNK